jgi:hypothetical protein
LGGAVISNVQIVQVNWGANVNPSIIALFEDWYPKVVTSPYVAWLSEYNTAGQQIGLGTYAKNPASNGSYTITPGNTATTISDAQIGSEIVSQLTAGKLPQPTKDSSGKCNTLYMIDFPAGISITQGASATSCQQFCAFHSSTSYNGLTIYYGVHPDIGTGGCAPSPNDAGQLRWHCGGSTDELIAAAATHSHEMVEAITDPAPLAWYDFASNCGEIGDICANQLPDPGTSASIGSLNIGGNTYYMQSEWSNAANDCIIAKGGAADGGTVEGGAIDSGAADSGGTADSGSDASGNADSGGGGFDSGGGGVDSGVAFDSGGGSFDASSSSDSGGGNQDTPASSGDSSGCGCKTAGAARSEASDVARLLAALGVTLLLVRSKRRAR